MDGHSTSPLAAAASNGFAIAALVLGIVGVASFAVPFVSWILDVLAIVFGILGLAGAIAIVVLALAA